MCRILQNILSLASICARRQYMPQQLWLFSHWFGRKWQFYHYKRISLLPWRSNDITIDSISRIHTVIHGETERDLKRETKEKQWLNEYSKLQLTCFSTYNCNQMACYSDATLTNCAMETARLYCLFTTGISDNQSNCCSHANWPIKSSHTKRARIPQITINCIMSVTHRPQKADWEIVVGKFKTHHNRKETTITVKV